MKKGTLLFLTAVMLYMIIPGSLLAYPKDEVRVALAYEPQTVNMTEMKTGIDIPVVTSMHESLMAVDPISGERTIRDSLSDRKSVV